jgi:spermidine dehydrogenase
LRYSSERNHPLPAAEVPFALVRENIQEREMNDSKRDRELGMQRPITRRDFLNGFSLAVGGALALPESIWTETFGLPGPPFATENEPGYYPPSKTGMRGSHDGSWEVAHAMRDGHRWGSAMPDAESYDLIVVGGGISGLAAAYFFRKQAGPKSRVLILENHDDFGGHAKRNEFQAGGRLLIGYGGTQSIQAPNLYQRRSERSSS